MFVHLRCHSHYSFLRGVNPPEEIIAAAVEQRMPAVALTDTNGMYAAVPFYQAALAAKVKPIVGVTLGVERDVKEVKEKSEVAVRLSLEQARDSSAALRASEFRKKKDSKSVTQSVAMVLLAADAEGYSNLCRLTTLRHLGVLRPGQETFAEDVGRPVTLEELAVHSAWVQPFPQAPFLAAVVPQPAFAARRRLANLRFRSSLSFLRRSNHVVIICV